MGWASPCPELADVLAGYTLRINVFITGAAATTGGIATVNLNLLRALIPLAAQRDGSLRVFSFLEGDWNRPKFLPAEVSFQGFQKKKLPFALAAITALRRNQILIFDHVTLALPILPMAIVGLARPVIFAHGSEAWKKIRWSSRLSFRHARLTLTNSEFTLRKMRERGVQGRLAACPLGLSPDLSLNTSIPAIPDSRMELEAASGTHTQLGDRVLLLVGRMHPREREKGHEELLAVWPTVMQEFSDAQLVFAGPGDDRSRLAEIARGRGVGRAVFLPGCISTDTLRRLYHRCHAYVMPSRQEGFGMVHLEAMNFGKPCLGCFDDGAEDVIVHEQTGLLLRQPVREAELLVSLRRLLGDPQWARRMGENGFRRLHEQFTAQQFQERFRRHISTLLPC